MRKFFWIFIFNFVFITSFHAQIMMRRDTVLMGSQFDITLTGRDSATIDKNIKDCMDEIIRIEQLISEWKIDTPISEVNRNSGIQPVIVSEEIWRLTKNALFFSEITDGAFDISIAAMDKIWYFDGSMEEIPTEEEIRHAIRYVNYKNIIIDSLKNSLFLKDKGMRIGFGATGKGYAAERAASLMKERGVLGGIINASGDLSVWGTQPDGKAWRIGIYNPYKPNKSADILEVRRGAITTSGDYMKYIEIDGVRYSHIIHPSTGRPVSGITSVTVLGPDAEMANGFSTSILLLGIEKGMELLRFHEKYACLIITNSGKIKKSKNYKKVKRAMQ